MGHRPCHRETATTSSVWLGLKVDSGQSLKIKVTVILKVKVVN